MNKLQHAVLTLLGVAALAAAGTGIALAEQNGALRRQIGDQQQYLQQSVQLEGLYREMVRALAELSARSGDEPMRALLQHHGISFNVNPGPAPAAAAQPARK